MNNEERILTMLDTMNTRLEQLTTDMSDIKGRMERVEDEVGGINIRMGGIDERVRNIEGIAVRIENDHGQKLDALFDGYKQNADRLDRIESEVTRHEDIILRRVK